MGYGKYLIAAHVRDENMMLVTTIYLANDAILWWHTRMTKQAGDERLNNNLLGNSERQLKDRFFPRNASWIAIYGQGGCKVYSPQYAFSEHMQSL